MNASDPYALASDGSALDPHRFREALSRDGSKLLELEPHPELKAILLGEDVDAMQQLLKAAFKVIKVSLDPMSGE